MLLLELGHVDGGDEAVAAVQQVRKGQRGFGLADAARADQQEHPDRCIRLVQTGSGGAHRAIQCVHRLFLATDACAQIGGETGDLGVVLAGQLRQWHTGPCADHFGDQTRTHFEADQTFFDLRGSQRGVGFMQLSFQRFDALAFFDFGDHGFNHGAFGVFFNADGRLDRCGFAGLGQLLTQFQQTLGQFFLFSPERFQCNHFAFGFIQPRFQCLQRFVIDQQTGLGIAAQGLTLTATFSQFATQALETFRGGGEADGHAGAGGVEDIDGFVRQLPTGQVTRGQFSGGHHRVIAQVDAVALLVDLSQTTQNGHRFADGRFVQLHRLEATGQRRIFLEVFLVLGPGGRGDGAQFATGQRRFQQVGRV